jgi:hypothetical protein
MDCVACNSLKPKNKSCWRHPRIQPGNLPDIDAGFAPAAPMSLPGSVASPAPHVIAILDHLFPQHTGYQKVMLPITSLSFEFICDCGAILSYYDMGAGPQARMPPAPAVKPKGTKIRANHGSLIWVIDSLQNQGGVPWYECKLAPGQQAQYNQYLIRVDAVDGLSYAVVP